MLITKIISSMEKCFIDQKPEDFAEISHLRIYKNSSGAFQLITYEPDAYCGHPKRYTIKVQGLPSDKIEFRRVESVANYIPIPQPASTSQHLADQFLRTEPGLYPDLLAPVLYNGQITSTPQQLHALWVDVKNNEDLPAGSYPLTLQVFEGAELISENHLTLEVIDALLPHQDTIVTQWLYADCIADYYELEVWSDKHFDYCRKFIKTAADNGINMMLVPVFTPPLDTAIGGERTTNQLVGVTREKGTYSFDYTLIDRWIDICLECGIKYFEISHLFTQWGAKHAPKIMAQTEEGYRRIFGWDTDASGDEYVTFLQAFLKSFTAYLSRRGLAEVTYFHISDEPHGEHIEQYRLNRKNTDAALHGFKILDALSDVKFYKEGLCPIPVPISDKIEDFMGEDIKERWVYYCWNPWVDYSNRYISMPSSRTRSIGMQMYKYGIKGFLHWGYNFYNDRYSYDSVNPFLAANAGSWISGGDAYSVYPGRQGRPLESLRIVAFRQGLEDIRVMRLCESYYSKEEVVKAVEDIIGRLTFGNCAKDAATMQKIRDRLDEMIIAALK
ncbi:MAG: DUF4091 domain-containing protein [Clostridia bacterium]|nr:DUF4091 domain-containing protein [Clostridia bacterium]